MDTTRGWEIIENVLILFLEKMFPWLLNENYPIIPLASCYSASGAGHLILLVVRDNVNYVR